MKQLVLAYCAEYNKRKSDGVLKGIHDTKHSFIRRELESGT